MDRNLEEILSFISQFQTLIAASIALAGVILTLVLNAKTARQQLDRHWLQEASSVRVALRGEIKQLIDAMTNQRKRLEELSDEDEGSFLVPLQRLDFVYCSLIPQLGKLEPQQVEAVLRLHAQYSVYRDKLSLLGATHASGQYTELQNQWRSVAVAHCGYVICEGEAALRAL